MANQLILGRALDANGYIAPGAKATVYSSGTSTLIPVYSDAAGTIAATNPILADGNGFWPQRYVNEAAKVSVTTSADVALYTQDPVPVSQTQSSSASLTGFTPSVNIPVTNAQSAIDLVDANSRARDAASAATTALAVSKAAIGFVTPRDFNATAGSGGDDTAAVQAAMASDIPMFIDRPYRISAAVTHSNPTSKLVFGNGPVASLITMTAATQDGLVKTGGGSLIVQNIGITTSVDKTAGAAISTSGTSKDLITNNMIYGTSGSVRLWVGISINGLIPNIEYNYILNCRNAAIVINNTTAGQGSEGTIHGNVMNTAEAGNAAFGILYNTGLRTLKITHNTIQSYANGIVASPATGYTPQSVLITGNVFESNGTASITASLPGGSTTVLDALIINGNQFNQTTGKSIVLAGATQFINIVSIVGNTFNFASSTQVELGNGSLATIDGNTFRATSTAFVPLQLTASFPVATYIGSNNTLSVTTFYAKNGNTGAWRAATIVAA